jgi:hypothetical protein
MFSGQAGAYLSEASFRCSTELTTVKSFMRLTPVLRSEDEHLRRGAEHRHGRDEAGTRWVPRHLNSAVTLSSAKGWSEYDIQYLQKIKQYTPYNGRVVILKLPQMSS